MSYPIQHISYSSLSKFHRDPGGWKEKYILNNWISKTSPAMLVGKMAHGVIELYMQGMSIEQAVEHQTAYLNSIPDHEVNWGKTGSRDKVLSDFTNAVRFYFEEMPNYGKILSSEKALTYTISDTIDGKTITSPLPFYGIPDLVYEDGKKLIIEDFKFKSAHTKDEEGPHPSYWIQGIFYYYLVRADLGRTPDEIRFREVKTSQNKNKLDPQHNVITINYNSEDFEIQKAFFWYQILGFCKFIEDADADSYFPYNIYDTLSGRETMDLMQNTIFGYKQNQAVSSDLVRVDRAEIREARFIESQAPDTIDGKIKYKYQEFGIALTFEEKKEGYSFDRYLFIPSRGVKMADVKKYAEDVAQATEMENIRIVAPVPGTKYVGVEVPRVEDRKYSKWKNEVMPIGRDINKKLHSLDLTNPDTPHVLIAGKSGSGKSQLIRTLIESKPKDMQLVCIDPKMVELSRYKGVSLMYASIPQDVLLALQNLEMEMTQRYAEMEKKGLSEIGSLRNRIMVVIDEYASIKLDPQYGKLIEKSLINITNMGRASGIHLIVATQRPSVDVISGLIKANIGCRICLSVASQMDSKVVLDQVGAEKLLGKGDLLYMYPGQEPIRLQALSLS